MVVTCGEIASAAFFVVVEVDEHSRLIVHRSEGVVEQVQELLVGQCLGEFKECTSQSAIVPFDVLLATGCVEAAPEFLANQAVVVGHAAHIRQFIADGHNLAVAVGSH